MLVGVHWILRGELPWPQVSIVSTIVAVAGVCLWIGSRGRMDIAGALLVGAMWCATTFYAFKTGYGMHSAAVYMYLPCMLYTALFFGIYVAAGEFLLTIAALLIMYAAEEHGSLVGAAGFARTGTNLSFLIGVVATMAGTLLAGLVFHRRIEHEAARVVEEARRRQLAMEQAQLAQAQVETAHARLTVLNGELHARSSLVEERLGRARDECAALQLALARDLPAAMRAGPEAGARLAAQLEELAVAATIEMRRESLDVSALASAVADAARAEAGGVAVSVEPHLHASADRTLLEAALAHLVRRAAAACRAEPGAKVRIGAASHEGTAMIYVRDSGPALDAAVRDRLLQPFGRGDAAVDTALAFARVVAERHGGALHVESVPGAGTTVMLSLGGADAA